MGGQNLGAKTPKPAATRLGRGKGLCPSSALPSGFSGGDHLTSDQVAVLDAAECACCDSFRLDMSQIPGRRGKKFFRLLDERPWNELVDGEFAD